MKGPVSFRRTIVVLFILTTLLYFFLNCDEQLLEFLSPENTESNKQRIDSFKDLLFVKAGKSVGKTWSVNIGAQGGVVRCTDHELHVPAGALDGDEKIKMTVIGFRPLEIDLQPDGLHFDNSATLNISYANANYQDLIESNFEIICLDDGVSIPSIVDTESKVVSGLIDHFSRYAISKGCSSITTETPLLQYG